MRSEFDSGLNTDKLSKTLDKILSRINEKVPDCDELKADMENVAKKSSSSNSSGIWMAAQQVLTKFIDENNDSTDLQKKGKAKRLKEMLGTILEGYDASPGKMEGVKNVVEEFTSLERSEIEKRMEEAQNYFTKSLPNNLSKRNVELKLRKILNNPSIISLMISNSIDDLNREKIVALLDLNFNLEKEDIDQYADSIESSVRSIIEEFDMDNEYRLIKLLESKMKSFFDGAGRQELDYSLLKDDVVKNMDDPKESIDIVKSRFSTFDSETLRVLVSNNKYIDESTIDSVLATIEDGKKVVQGKIL